MVELQGQEVEQGLCLGHNVYVNMVAGGGLGEDRVEQRGILCQISVCNKLDGRRILTKEPSK